MLSLLSRLNETSLVCPGFERLRHTQIFIEIIRVCELNPRSYFRLKRLSDLRSEVVEVVM